MTGWGVRAEPRIDASGHHSMVFRENVLYAYTDGSSLRTPRRGGFAIRFIYVDDYGEEQVQDIQSPGNKNATNNEMELKACVVALEEAEKQQAA